MQTATMKLTQAVYDQILQTIGIHEPEIGGILGAGPDGIITDFYFDRTGVSAPDRYIPDVATINTVLQHDWFPREKMMVGLVHSHANGNSVPSCGDINYGFQILQALDHTEFFFLPIVTSQANGPCLFCYLLFRNGNGQFCCQSVKCETVN